MNVLEKIEELEEILKGDWSPTTTLRDELTRPRTPSFTLPELATEEEATQIKEHFIGNWTVGLVRILTEKADWPVYTENAKEYIFVFTPNSTVGEATMLQWMDDLIRNKVKENTKITFETIRKDMADPTGPRFFMRIGSISFDANTKGTLEGSVSTEFSSCLPVHQKAATILADETKAFIKGTKKIQAIGILH